MKALVHTLLPNKQSGGVDKVLYVGLDAHKATSHTAIWHDSQTAGNPTTLAPERGSLPLAHGSLRHLRVPLNSNTQVAGKTMTGMHLGTAYR